MAKGLENMVFGKRVNRSQYGEKRSERACPGLKRGCKRCAFDSTFDSPSSEGEGLLNLDAKLGATRVCLS